ncbi:MAG: MFS transporter [Desulforhopalus sp.]|jgi:predicted MFS family arabinose efflux permease|nr:MFS transporter [Desulforhopalus sp.]
MTLPIFRVFLPFAAGYFLSYLFRVVNAVIAPDLLNDLGVGPSALGMLTAVYFISFASFQLPLGVLLDRFGPRRVEAALLLIAGLGALLFARAESLAELIIGRAAIGFGVSACLMAAFKAYTLWFSREKWPMINGLQMASGGLGALAATAPVETALIFTDWRGVFTGLAVLTIAVALVILFVVPEKKGQSSGQTLADQLRGTQRIFTSRSFWRLAPLTAASQMAFMAIQGLWSGPWLSHVGGLERAEVARVLFWVAAAMIAGFILLGTLTGRLQRRGFAVATVAVTLMCLFMTVQALLIFAPPHWLFPLWLAFGFLGTSGIIAYSALTMAFSIDLSGRVTTAVNLLVFVAAFFGQWLIGAVIDSVGSSPNGILAENGFDYGFGLLLALQVLALGYYLFPWFYKAPVKPA